MVLGNEGKKVWKALIYPFKTTARTICEGWKIPCLMHLQLLGGKRNIKKKKTEFQMLTESQHHLLGHIYKLLLRHNTKTE